VQLFADLSVCLSTYIYIYLSIYLSIYGSTALVDFCRFFSFLIYTQSAGLPGRGVSPSRGRYLHTEYTHADIHALSGIRTHDPSVRVGEDSSSFGQRGPCDRRTITLVKRNKSIDKKTNQNVKFTAMDWSSCEGLETFGYRY
jgi:hypothetical protein